MELTNKYGNASWPTWKGEVWIVGGGPGLKDFDLRRLEGKRVLSVNGHGLSAFLVSSSIALFSLDNTWVRRNRQLLTTFSGEKFVALPLETWPDCGNIPGVIYLRWSHDLGLSDDPGVICCGCHSGFGALNLAYLKGANEIHLVGFDLNPADDEQFEFWIPYYLVANPQLEKRGIRVINHSLNSCIDAFPKEI